MNLSRLTWGGLLLAGCCYGGCGGIAVIDGEAGAAAGGAGGASSVTTSTSSSGVGGSQLDLALVQAFGFANCMPQVPPDPLDLEIVVAVTNSSNQSVGLSFVQGRLLSSKGNLVFAVDPSKLVIGPNADQQLGLKKVNGSASGDNACALCGASDTVLVLELEVDGAPLGLEGPLNSLSCAL